MLIQCYFRTLGYHWIQYLRRAERFLIIRLSLLQLEPGLLSRASFERVLERQKVVLDRRERVDIDSVFWRIDQP